MARDLHKLMRLASGCGCVLGVDFATGAENDGSGSVYNPRDWEKLSSLGGADYSGSVDTSSGSLESSGPVLLKWIGTCPSKYARGLAFRLKSAIPSGMGRIYYAADEDLNTDTGYIVEWRTIDVNEFEGVRCNLKVKYGPFQTELVSRMIPLAGASDELIVSFAHVADEDGGGVHITIEGVGTYTHLDGPQISAATNYWGISVAGLSPATIDYLEVKYNGASGNGGQCVNCPEETKGTGCDLTASCGGGTYITQPGETLIDYEWPAEACDGMRLVSPYNDGGWYKDCDPGDDSELDYSHWTFADMVATMSFPGAGKCGGAAIPNAGTGLVAWRYFRVTSCAGVVTLSISMAKSRFQVALATLQVLPACGVAGSIFDDLSPTQLDEAWPASATGSYVVLTTCSGSASAYVIDDACIADDNDTVTVDVLLPPGIYRAIASCAIPGQDGVAAHPTACAPESVTDVYPPVSYEFEISGDALAYDPICR